MQAQRSVIWTGINRFSAEYLSLALVDTRWRIQGHVITTFHGEPAYASYSILCNDQWVTRHVQATCHVGDTEKSTTLHRRDSGWSIDGTPVPSLTNCIDIDLEITPFTNTLPINRLRLDIGQTTEVMAAWLRFPLLAVEPLRQRYTRLEANRYLYESGSSFRAEITVDDDGVVLDYENGWQRAIAPSAQHLA